MLRFLLCVAAKRVGATGQVGFDDDDELIPEPFAGESLHAHRAGEGIDIGVLARSAADGRNDWDWETIPEMCEHFRRLTEA
jgi:hypothetical protein